MTPAHTAPPLVTGGNCPARLAARTAVGGVVLLQARVSTPDGGKAIHDAITNVFTAAAALSRHKVFPGLPSLLPTRSDLTRRMREDSTVRRSRERDDDPFVNRFLTLRSPRHPQLYLHISTGSGTKIDHDSYHSPVAEHAARYIESIRPAVICAAEVARWSRNGYLLSPWVQAVEFVGDDGGEPVFLSFDGDRPRPFTPEVRAELFHRADEAGAETKRMKQRTTSAIRGKKFTDLGGYSPYPFSTPPPPGLALVRLRSDAAGKKGQHTVIVDTPELRALLKDRKLILYGLSEVYDEDSGRPVDQLALVRFYLAHRGLPDWPPRRLVAYLVSRGYSTEGLRRNHKSPGMSWRGRRLTKSVVWNIIRGIETHLQYYRSGILVRKVGDKGEAMKYTTLWPPDGKRFMTEDDYRRILATKRKARETFERFHRYTFGHQPVLANGAAARFVIDRTDDGDVVYHARRYSQADLDRRAAGAHSGARTLHHDPPDPHPNPNPHLVPHPASSAAVRRPAARIPARAFATSIFDGLRKHHGTLAAFIPPTDPEPSHAADHHAELTRVVQRKQKEHDEIFAIVLRPEGRDALYGELLADANRDYNRLDQELKTLRRDLAEAALAVQREQHTHDPRTIAVNDLLGVIDSLRDPEDTSFLAQWRHSIVDLEVTSEYVTEAGRRLSRTRWRGNLLVHEGADERVIPFDGTHDREPARRPCGAAEVIADMRTGSTRLVDRPYWRSGTGHARLRKALGVEPGAALPVLTIRNPRLLRLTMAVVYPPLTRATRAGHDPSLAPRSAVVSAPLTPAQLRSAARRLGEPLTVLRRIAHVTPAQGHRPGTSRKWQTAGDRAVADLCRLAARGHGTLTSSSFDEKRWVLLRHAARRCDPRLFTFTRGRITMQPCPWCGSLRRGHLTIREATEPVCWACRRDISGIEWPAKPYDRYRVRCPAG